MSQITYCLPCVFGSESGKAEDGKSDEKTMGTKLKKAFTDDENRQ